MVHRLLLMALLNCLLVSIGQAQDPQEDRNPDPLTIEEAIRIGLENNFSIRIARNRAEISDNNRTIGNAGFLPELTATGSRTESVENSLTEFSGDAIPDRDVTGARSSNTSASASLNWTIFDGLGMFTTYERLSELEKLGDIEARLAIENNIAQIIVAYFNIIRQQNIADVLQSTVELSEQRIQIAETMKDLGSGSEYDLLQARADLNADRAAVIRQEVSVNDAMVLLNELIGREVDTRFAVGGQIPVNDQLNYDEIVTNALSGNLRLAIAKANQRVTELQIREIEAERYPEIALNLGYGYNLNESGSGFLELSRSTGFNYGVTARITLFDGFDINLRKQNARIQLKNQQLTFEQQKLQVSADIRSEFTRYLKSLQLVELERENLVYARQTVEIALERFKLGTINSIELREAQRTLIDAESRLIQAQFEAKTAETELLRLTGILGEDRKS